MSILNSKKSITRKFTITFILLIFIPILALNLAMSYFQAGKIADDYKNSQKLTFSEIPEILLSDITFALQFSDVVYSDYDINTFLGTTFVDAKDFYSKYETYNVNKFLDFYASQSPNLSVPEIYTDNPSMTGETINLRKIDEFVVQSNWYQSFINSGENAYIHVDSVTRYVSVLRKLNLNASSEYTNILRITVDLDHVQEALDQIETPTSVFLVGDKSIPLYTWIGTYVPIDALSYYIPLKEDTVGNDLALVYSENIDYYGNLKLIFVLEKAPLFDISNMGIVGGTLIITLVGSILFMLLMKRNYISRIEDLVDSIDVDEFITPSGDPEKKKVLFKRTASKNELALVQQTVSNMSERIHALIKEAYALEMEKNQAEIRRKQSELNSLLSQINPHYLFNVLNAIRLKSLIKGEKETAKIILYVSKIFRQSITWNEDVIPLQEEINFIKEYLAIEKYRFEDKLTYEIILAEEANTYEIPKMALQPFVENACVHGVQNQISQGKITVEVKEQDENNFIFAITNPVVEFTAQTKAQILGYSNGNFDVDTKSVGLKNTFARLRHYYESFSFDIIQTEGEVTFMLILPKHTTKTMEE